MAPSSRPSDEVEQINKTAAIRFIHAFNTDDWDIVREVVAEGFVFHHPLGGTVEAGPDGMVSIWAGFKVLSPDSWHPIPVMIADGDYVAVLLPTYGTFTGQGEHSPPPTGGRLDYGMVNMVRFEDGQLAEMWFGMDSLAEFQQMGVAPMPTPPELSPAATANLSAFETEVSADGTNFDNIAPFDDVVVAVSPPQADHATTSRRLEVYRFDAGGAHRIYDHQMVTDPPYEGSPSADGEASRAIVHRWINDVLSGDDSSQIAALVTPHLVIHPTAMPGEARFYGPAGAAAWLEQEWRCFAGLTLFDTHSVAQRDLVAVRWTARGTSQGEFMELPATGQSVEFTGVSLYRVEDERVAEIWDTRNTLNILHQLDPDLGPGGHQH